MWFLGSIVDSDQNHSGRKYKDRLHMYMKTKRSLHLPPPPPPPPPPPRPFFFFFSGPPPPPTPAKGPFFVFLAVTTAGGRVIDRFGAGWRTLAPHGGDDRITQSVYMARHPRGKLRSKPTAVSGSGPHRKFKSMTLPSLCKKIRPKSGSC